MDTEYLVVYDGRQTDEVPNQHKAFKPPTHKEQQAAPRVAQGRQQKAEPQHALSVEDIRILHSHSK